VETGRLVILTEVGRQVESQFPSSDVSKLVRTYPFPSVNKSQEIKGWESCSHSSLTRKCWEREGRGFICL